MAKKQSMSSIDKMLAENLSKESKVLPGISRDYSLINAGDSTEAFDYIEKWTGEKQTLSTPTDVINNNYINAQYLEGKKNAEEQGFGGELGGFLAQAVAGEIVLGTVEGLGYLLDVQHWGAQLVGGDPDYGNWLSDLAAQGKEQIREWAPIYEDPDNINRSVWENMLHGDGWWANNGVSIASSLSILIPVAGYARGMSMLGKAGTAIGGAARVGQLGGKAAKVTKTYDKVMDMLPAKSMVGETTKQVVDGIHKATISRLIESQMEATAVFKDRYDYYMENTELTEDQARKAAGEAADFTYKANWAALATDIPQYLFLGGRGARLKNQLHIKRPGFLKNSKLLEQTKKLRAIGTTMGTEGIEEAYQFIASEEGKLVGDTVAGIRNDSSTFGERLGEYVKEGELWTSAIFGALGGGVFKTAGPGATKLMNKAFRRGESYLDEKDVRANEEKDRFTKLSANMARLKKATNIGDEQAIFQAKRDMVFELASNATKANNWVQARSSIAQLKNATPEERAEYGIDEEFMADIDEWLDYADVAADKMSRARDKYTYGLADMVVQREFSQHMNKINSDKIQSEYDTELRESIPNIDTLSNEGHGIMEETIEIAAQEKAIEVLDKRIQSGELSAIEEAATRAQQERAQAYIKSIKDTLKERSATKKDLNENDKLAIETVENGGADDVVTLRTKQRILEMINNVTSQELTFLKSRKGRRWYKEERAKRYKEIKDTENRTKQKAKADAAASPDTTETPEFGGRDIGEIAKAIDAGTATWQTYANTPEEIERLKKAVAHYKMFIDENPEVLQEEAEEDALLEDLEDELIFDENQDDIEDEVIDETEGSEVMEERDAQEDLNEELEAAEAHEEIEVPSNEREERAWRAGDDLSDPTLNHAPNQMAWLSTNNEIFNPTSLANNRVIKKLEKTFNDLVTKESPQALANWLLKNAKVGDKILHDNGEGYVVTDIFINKKGIKEITLMPFDETGVNTKAPIIISEETKGSNIATKFSVKKSSHIYKFAYTNTQGNRVVGNAVYKVNNTNSLEAKKALSAFLESPSTIMDNYDVKFEIDTDFIAENPTDRIKKMMAQIEKGELPSRTDIGYLPVKATIYQKGNPVEYMGHTLKMSLHDPSFFYKSDGVTPKYPGHSEQLKTKAILHKEAIISKIIKGVDVYGKLEGKSRGKLNVATGEKNFVAQTLKKPVENLQFLIGNKAGKYVTADKRVRLSIFSSAKPGAVYVQTQTANGKPFPLRLEVNNLTNGLAGIVHALYVDLLENPDLINGQLNDSPKGIRNHMKDSQDPIVTGLSNFIDLDTITYGELLQELVYEGSRTKASDKGRLLHYVNTRNVKGELIPNSVHFGNEKMNLERLEHPEGKKLFIDWLTANKRVQINANRLNDLEYKNWINNARLVTTNALATPEGNLFVQPVIGYSNKMRVQKSETIEEKTVEDTEYETFVDSGVVSAETLDLIVNKILNNEALTSVENAIFHTKTSEINELIRKKEASEEKKSQVQAASTVKNTINMFQKGLKAEKGGEIEVNLPEEDDFDENPC